MKNIFKMMGVALLACSMIMVSCKKDDSSDTSDGGFTLKIDNESHSWNFSKAQALDQDGTWVLGVFQASVGQDEEGMVQFPYFFTAFYAATHQQTGENLMVICDFVNGSYSTELYYETYVEYGEDYIGDYQLEDFNSYDFGTFDATAHTLTCNYDMKFYDYVGWNYAIATELQAHGYTVEDWNAGNVIPEAEQEEIFNAADANTEKKNVVLGMKNYQFEVAQ